jgi:quercetin dioxygenase-like cupin family protein
MRRFGMLSQKEPAAMKCLRIYATPDGESHFDEVELFEVTASYPASRVRITRIPAGMREVAWHRVPEPVLTVRLDGSVEYETSDGEVRHVQAGSFVLVEDTHGKGHLSRHSAEAQTVIWVSLPNGLDAPPE